VGLACWGLVGVTAALPASGRAMLLGPQLIAAIVAASAASLLGGTAAAAPAAAWQGAYELRVTHVDPAPIISSLNPAGSGRCTAATLCYNAAFLPVSHRSPAGLLLRLRNMSIAPGPRNGANKPPPGSSLGPSMLGFSRRSANGSFSDVPPSAIVFRPSDVRETLGTEDPRVALDTESGTFVLAYTAFSHRADPERGWPNTIELSLATTETPAIASSWRRHGAAIKNYPNKTKSGAMLLRKHPNPSYLIFLDTQTKSAHLAVSVDPDHLVWEPRPGNAPFLAPRAAGMFFDDHLTEPGPPPLPLEAVPGQAPRWVFFYNGAANATALHQPQYRRGCYLPIKTVYSVGWMILEEAAAAEEEEEQDGSSGVGLRIVERAAKPLLTPTEVPGGYALGRAPALCKQPNIAFVEGAEPLGGDRFRIFFGAADATEGSAVVQITAAAAG
jgi:predicted GH43/DUF377 family glycosyl hydrolase